MPRKQKLPKGLRLRGQTFWYSLTVGGRREQASCHTSDLKRAIAVLELRKAEIHDGRYTPNRKKNDLTVEGLRDLWFSRPATEAKRSLKDDQQRFRTIVELLGAGKLVNSLTLADMEEMQKALSKRTKGKGDKLKRISGTTINRHLALLSSALNHASNHGYAHQNPLKGLKRAPERHKDDVFSDEEFEALLRHPKTTTELALVMWIGFETGMRLGEVVGMTWDRVNLSDDVRQRGMRLLECHSKTGNPIIVPISDRLLGILKQAKADRNAQTVRQLKNEPLVNLKSGRVSANFSAIAKALGYSGTFHALRHTAISKLDRAGVSLATIMAIVGHKNASTTLHYITVDPAEKHQAVSKLASKPAQNDSNTTFT